MLRSIHPLLLIGALCSLLFIVFQVSFSVQATEQEISRLQQQLRQEREAMHVLEAEWAYITRPDRLAELAARYLNMVPATTRDIAQLDGLPEIPAMPQPPKAQPATRATPQLVASTVSRPLPKPANAALQHEPSQQPRTVVKPYHTTVWDALGSNHEQGRNSW
jgi:hypothetical protein